MPFGVNNVKGFAVLVEDEKGKRTIIYSDDIKDASFMLTVVPPIMESVAGPLGEPTATYRLSIAGGSFGIRQDTEPLDEMLNEPPRQIEAEDRRR